MNVKENLIAARAKIADPKDWIRGSHAEDESGCSIAANSEKACKYCGVGALLAVSPPGHENLFEDSYLALVASAEALYSHTNVAKVNDVLGHEAILKIYDHAINSASASDLFAVNPV